MLNLIFISHGIIIHHHFMQSFNLKQRNIEENQTRLNENVL